MLAPEGPGALAAFDPAEVAAVGVTPTPKANVPAARWPSTLDTVRHETLGEGIVTRIEPGGVVTVRFAGEETERRLMLDYAPLERVG